MHADLPEDVGNARLEVAVDAALFEEPAHHAKKTRSTRLALKESAPPAYAPAAAVGTGVVP